MATWDDVRTVALALPETSEHVAKDGTLSWAVRTKAIAWQQLLLDAWRLRAPKRLVRAFDTAT